MEFYKAIHLVYEEEVLWICIRNGVKFAFCIIHYFHYKLLIFDINFTWELMLQILVLEQD